MTRIKLSKEYMMRNHPSILKGFSHLFAILLIATSLGACTGLHSYEVVTEETADDASNLKQLTPTCPAGKVAIGGGARVFGHPDNISLFANGPEGTPSAPTKWFGAARETTPSTLTWGLRVDVICAKKSP